MRERHRVKPGVTGKKGQCVKAIDVVDKRIIALMRNDEVHEMEVVCSMRQTPEMSP